VQERRLQEAAGLADRAFSEALAEALTLQFAVRSPDGTISEGTRQMNQPDPGHEINYPLLRFAPLSQPLWERIYLAVLSACLVAFLIYLITQKATFSRETWKLAVVLASVLAAAVGAFLTGMLEVRHQRPGLDVRATGALGAFVLVLVVLLI